MEKLGVEVKKQENLRKKDLKIGRLPKKVITIAMNVLFSAFKNRVRNAAHLAVLEQMEATLRGMLLIYSDEDPANGKQLEELLLSHSGKYYTLISELVIEQKIDSITDGKVRESVKEMYQHVYNIVQLLLDENPDNKKQVQKYLDLTKGEIEDSVKEKLIYLTDKHVKNEIVKALIITTLEELTLEDFK